MPRESEKEEARGLHAGIEEELIHLCSAVPCNVADNAACLCACAIHFSAACYNPAQSVVVCLKLKGGDVQQHVASLMCPSVPCNADDSAA